MRVAISATLNCTPWNAPRGRPNCSRVRTWRTARSSAPWATPMPWAATWSRVRLKNSMNWRNPSPRVPIRFEAGTRTSSSTTSAVSEARMPILRLSFWAL